MIDRPWIGFGIVSGVGFILLVLSVFSATDSLWIGLAGVLGIFFGWVLFSAAFWLAATSAGHALLGGRPAGPRKQVLAAGQLISAGAQTFTYIVPNAAISRTWEPRSPVLNSLTLVYALSGPVLISLGLVLSIWALVESGRFRGRASARIRFMHMQGNWPVWFDNEVMDEPEKAPISEDLKIKGIALSQLFESSTTWDDTKPNYEWISYLALDQFNQASRAFAQDLAAELGPKFFVATEVQRTKRLRVRFEQQIFLAS